jgi:two-component system sensor histidine kinase/response regulator
MRNLGEGDAVSGTVIGKRSIEENHSVLQGDLANLRVIVVDDNPTNRNILKLQLEQWGVRSDCAENGTDALQLLRSACTRGEPYDLAILDRMMPGMDGLQLASAIKADPSIARTRLVMFSGYYEQDEKVKSSGIAAYLVKPVLQATLRQCIAQVMGVAPSGNLPQS